MTFSSIIRKNFIHNFNKYISFYLINALIVAMLFMYGSLMFNPIILQSIGKTSLYETIKIALIGIVIFSIVFITYTNIAFLKNRGKEFGMYLTLGMTTKDLMKQILIENLGIMVSSSITGILGGVIFGRLFYMGLNKILNGASIPYKLNYKSFLLSLGIFLVIFLCNLLFNVIYIRKMSIMEILKSSKKSEIGKKYTVIGLIALVLFIISLYCLPKTLLNEIFKNKSYMLGLFITFTIICPYMIIGTGIVLIKEIFNKFPRAYNKNILILSNLSHRFLGYKNVLYMISLLMAGAMFFVGFSYSLYVSSREYINMNNPFDIMFVEDEGYNKIKKEEVEKIIEDEKGTIKDYKILECLNVPMFRAENEGFIFWGARTVVSESNYNKHMNETIDIKPSSAQYINVVKEKIEFNHPKAILATLSESQVEEARKLEKENINNNYVINEGSVEKVIGNSYTLNLEKENIESRKGVPFVNHQLGSAFVLNDMDYELLKNKLSVKAVENIHLINVKNGDKGFYSLVNYLRIKNNLDESFWKEGNLWGKHSYDEEGRKEYHRPMYKEELIKLQIENYGIVFFTMSFIGLLFVIANGVVLYYKVLSDVDNEEERIESLIRIGVTEKEIETLISKELAITFFIPILVGGGLGMYYLYVMCSNMIIVKLLMKKALLILGLGTSIQIIFYLISRKKYIKEVI
ncbi:ABC transporter permease [Clostridium senegalense]|uniref:ABC transporter permease n=1 Tax=Clostridium senegalense TaxID=1465809 RepID=UPI00028A0FEF|nr:ABC transporter permease [Clostridium senegalense]